MNDLESDTQVYNRLAEDYKLNKKNAIVNILRAGQILCNAKEQLSFGQFGVWLQDHRVSESQRTSQRLMAIYGNFGHLLDRGDKVELIENLPITFLLELQKLPERFRKDIEVVTVQGNEEHREIKQVIDEDKLSNFLDTPVETKEGVKQLKELPVSELRKYLNDVRGVYEPESFHEGNEDSSDSDDAPSTFVESRGDVYTLGASDIVGQLVNKLTLLSDLSGEFVKLGVDIDIVKLYEANEDDKAKLSDLILKFKGLTESIYVKLNDIESKMRG